MPRPQPLVSLHGSVDFSKLVPFNSAPNAPPLAANDVLVMRKAAGGDNLIITIGDITSTGSVPISGLTGGANDDLLFRAGGVWQGSGSDGLTYDGNFLQINDSLGLSGLNLIGGAGITIDDLGGLEIEGGGGIAIEDAGSIGIDGGGNYFASGGSGIQIQGTGDIDHTGTGNIAITGTGQMLAAMGSELLPAYSFALDPDSGIYNQGGIRYSWATDGDEIFRWDDENITGRFVSPSWLLNNEDSPSGTTPVFSFTNDGNTGIGSAGLDLLSIIAGGVEIARAKQAVNDNQL